MGISKISLVVLLAGVASLTILLAGAASADDHLVPNNAVTVSHHGHGNGMMPYENTEHHMNAMSHRENCDEMMVSSKNAMSGYHMGPRFRPENVDGMVMLHEDVMVRHRVDMAEHMRTAGCNGHSH